MTKKVRPFQKSVGGSWRRFQLTEAYRFLIVNDFLWCSAEPKQFAEFEPMVYCLGQSPEEVEGDLGDYFLREDFDWYTEPESVMKPRKHPDDCYCEKCNVKKSKED